MDKLGFTGTSQGATIAQLATLHRELKDRSGEFHHGDCVEADEDAHDIADELGLEIIIHPPENDRKRAFKKAKHIRKPKLYLERNHDIVDETNVLYAMPKGYEEELRSGTWATIRYARKLKRCIIIIWPNGSTETEAYDVQT